MSTAGELQDLIEQADRAIEAYEGWQRAVEDISTRQDRMDEDPDFDDGPTVNEVDDVDDFARNSYEFAMELVKELLEQLS